VGLEKLMWVVNISINLTNDKLADGLCFLVRWRGFLFS